MLFILFYNCLYILDANVNIVYNIQIQKNGIKYCSRVYEIEQISFNVKHSTS